MTKTKTRELLISLAVVVVGLLAAIRFDAFEGFAAWVRRYDEWRFDELFFVPLVLVVLLLLYYWRRNEELEREVGERGRAEEEFRQQMDLYEGMLNIQSELGEGFVVLEDQRLRYANEAFCKISGYDLAELRSLSSVMELVPEEESTAILERRRRHLSGDPLRHRPTPQRRTPGRHRGRLQEAGRGRPLPDRGDHPRHHGAQAGRGEAPRGRGEVPHPRRAGPGGHLRSGRCSTQVQQSEPHDVREPPDRGADGLPAPSLRGGPRALGQALAPRGPRAGPGRGRAHRRDRRALQDGVQTGLPRRPGGVGQGRGCAGARRGGEPELLAGHPARHNRAQGGRKGAQRERAQAAHRYHQRARDAIRPRPRGHDHALGGQGVGRSGTRAGWDRRAFGFGGVRRQAGDPGGHRPGAYRRGVQR